MKTLQVHSFPINNSQSIKKYSITAIQKRYYTEQQPEKYLKSKSLLKQSEFKQKINKKFIYFHQNPKPSPTHPISFPYNSLNLCYSKNQFGDKKQPKTPKIYNFDTNNSIRNFLNSKLKTQPVKQTQQNPEKQIFIGKKQDEKRIHNDENIKIKLLSSIAKYQSLRNGRQNSKGEKVDRFVSVLKIKSKKAYFLSRYKNKVPQVKQNYALNFEKKIQSQNQQSVFDLNYRSKTEDNINLINQMREQQKGNMSVIKKQRIRYKSIRQKKQQQTVDPWQSNQIFQQTLFKFNQNYY